MAKQITTPNPARIKVIGCGGGGCNAVARMCKEGIQGAELIVLNTDAQALQLSEVPVKLQVGERLTRGLGAGGDPSKGRKAAEESQDIIRDVVKGADMVFIAAGLGGGTGTGAAPLVAQMAKESGALTIATVTKPFSFEGVRRRGVAEEGARLLAEHVDTLIAIPNDKLLTVSDTKTVVDSAFRLSDDILAHAVKAITEVITVPGLINLDFADIQAIMKDGGQAWLSIGIGTGPNRAVDAAKNAIHSQLLDISVKGATGVLYNVTGSNSLTLHEVNEAARLIQSEVDPNANIIFGVVFDSKMDAEVRITLIATGVARGVLPSRPEELKRLLSRPEEGELDIPTFIRRPSLSGVRRSQPTPIPLIPTPPSRIPSR